MKVVEWFSDEVVKWGNNKVVERSGEVIVVEWIRTKPSNSPSPVVAQLGTTYQSLSFSWSSLSSSCTSAGFIAELNWID